MRKRAGGLERVSLEGLPPSGAYIGSSIISRIARNAAFWSLWPAGQHGDDGPKRAAVVCAARGGGRDGAMR
jgi:hypothetical protein